MGTMGGTGRRHGRPGWTGWLAALLLAWGGAPMAQELALSRLADDVPAEAVLSGRMDHRLVPQPGRVLFEKGDAPAWWRVTVDRPVAAAGLPHLLLEGPYLTRIEAWVPGAAGPSLHSGPGAAAEPGFSSRALAIPLPHGLAPGQPVWLRVQSFGAVPMTLSIRSFGQIHHGDLVHVAWRSGTLSALVAIALLAFGFWVGVGERSYGYFFGMLLSSAVYLALMGGELWGLHPALDRLVDSPRPARLFASLGAVFSNSFVLRYLDLRRSLPWMGRVMQALVLWMLAVAAMSLLVDHGSVPFFGNLGLAASAIATLLASLVLALRGQRAGMLVLAAWLPLVVLSVLRVGEMLGGWPALPWTRYALDGSFVLAGMVLTIGLADKLLELRRDRDRAHLDGLTGILGRQAIEAGLEREIAHAAATGEPPSVAFVDFDNFKRINDQHGHAAGDECLRVAAARLAGSLRAGDLLGRYGGDEFLVVMPRTGLREARAVAERLRTALDRGLATTAGIPLEVSLSIGVAQWQPGETAAGLLRRADAGLYASKADGRNRVSVGLASTDGPAV